MPDARMRRIAENEVRFRAINERLEADLRRLPSDGEPVGFICECGHPECTESVPLTIDEYERVRADPVLFALLPGHEIDDVEDVVTVTDRYVVVRKKAPSRPLAEATDPRRPAS
jgi:hypothetical protein